MLKLNLNVKKDDGFELYTTRWFSAVSTPKQVQQDTVAGSTMHAVASPEKQGSSGRGEGGARKLVNPAIMGCPHIHEKTSQLADVSPLYEPMWSRGD